MSLPRSVFSFSVGGGGNGRPHNRIRYRRSTLNKLATYSGLTRYQFVPLTLVCVRQIGTLPLTLLLDAHCNRSIILGIAALRIAAYWY